MVNEMIQPPVIGVLVSRDRQRYLRRVTPRVAYSFYNDWVELTRSDPEASASAFIVDPMRVPVEHRVEVLKSLGNRHRVPVVLVAKKLTRRLAPILVEAGRARIRHFMVWGTDDDSSERVRSLLAQVLLEIP